MISWNRLSRHAFIVLYYFWNRLLYMRLLYYIIVYAFIVLYYFWNRLL